MRWQRINNPILFPLSRYQAPASKVGEVLGDFHLRLTQNVLKMTNAEW